MVAAISEDLNTLDIIIEVSVKSSILPCNASIGILLSLSSSDGLSRQSLLCLK